MATIKRGLEESNTVRELVYATVATLEIPSLAFVGRTNEGLAFQDDEGKAVILKTIVKALDYDAEYEAEAYIATQEVKAKEAKAKAEAKARKLAKKAGEVKIVKEATQVEVK